MVIDDGLQPAIVMSLVVEPHGRQPKDADFAADLEERNRMRNARDTAARE